MDPLLDALAAALGCPTERAEMALATLAADLHARCRTYGEATYEGLGTFRSGPDGLTFEPHAALAIVVNHRFAGQNALPTGDVPAPVWDPAPPPPAATPLPAETIFFPWQDAEPEAPSPLDAPDAALGDPVPTVPAEADPTRFHPPVLDTVRPATPRPAPSTWPLAAVDEAERPARASERASRGWMLPVLLLVLAGVISAAAYLWWRRSATSTPPPAPVAALPPAATPAVDSARADSTAPPAISPPPAPAEVPPAVPPSTDRAATPSQLRAAAPAPRPAAPAVAPRTPAPTRGAPPPPPSPARVAAAPVRSAPAVTDDAAALRGQEPVEPGRGGWTVVMGGAANEDDAEALARPLRLRGYRTGVLAGLRADSTPIYRIGLGHFATRDAALAALARHRGDLFPADAWVLRLR